MHDIPGTYDNGTSLRVVTKIYNTNFSSSIGPDNVIDAKFVANNEQNTEKPRFIMEGCIFRDSTVAEDMVYYSSDQLGTMNNFNVSSIILYETSFLNNDANYVINPSMDGTISTVAMRGCIFEENTIGTAVINLDYVSLNMTNSDSDSHILLIDGINPISTYLDKLNLYDNRRIDN